MSSPAPSASPSLRRSVAVAAPAEHVFGLVSDLPGMGRFSPENRGGRWVSGDGPAVGAVFRGRNQQGWRRCGTRSVVVEHEPPRRFAFDVSYLGLAVATWRFEVEPEGEGCRLTETWEDRRGGPMRRLGALGTGVTDREAFAVTSVEQTLAAVKAAAEADVTDRR